VLSWVRMIAIGLLAKKKNAVRRIAGRMNTARLMMMVLENAAHTMVLLSHD
jgi:hypothetical protein